ncbi:MAG: PEP-CTERM sorting domain-containing protein [Gammaproteobacteria bacterium]|nr:PEP-CTERM sorting domain-containing protein [Gammaproteobacteria bacterium]
MTALANGATFTPLGADLQSYYFAVNDVSADGSVVTGSVGVGFATQAYRWTAATGFTGMGAVSPSATSIARAISANGNVIVGLSNGEAFRWTPADGMTGLGNLSSFSEGATGVSADGTVVAGIIGGESNAAVWSAGNWTLLSPLPTGRSSAAFGISGDGLVVVGRSSREDDLLGPVQEATRWVDGVPLGLGDLAGGTFFSRAQAASADGSVVVGWSNGEYRIDGAEGGWEVDLAFRWTAADGMVALDQMSGVCCEPRGSRAVDISADGRIIVGNRDGDGATIWIDGADGVRLLDLLAAQGATGLEGWSLAATAISADGRTIVGLGHNASNPDRDLGWVATLDAATVPSPPSVLLLATSLAALGLRRLRS